MTPPVAYPAFHRRLEATGERLTGPRRAVADLIARREGHFTAADLVADASGRQPAIGRATIFRTLELLTGLGLLERLDLPTGEHAYVACEPRHHHHVVCDGCGRTAEVGDLGLGDVIESMERRTGFRIDAHRLEAYGRCARCRAADGALAGGGH
jgi:Fur family ferric uptake transcriptional regulator